MLDDVIQYRTLFTPQLPSIQHDLLVSRDLLAALEWEHDNQMTRSPTIPQRYICLTFHPSLLVVTDSVGVEESAVRFLN